MGKLPLEERIRYVLNNNDVDVKGFTREQKEVLLRIKLADQETEYRSYAEMDPLRFKEEVVDGLVRGSIDTHCHGGSDPLARLLLEDEIAEDYTRIGIRAVCIKTHYTPSASRTALVQKHIDRWAKERGMEPVQVFGGITLNKSVGGLNPEAVRWALRFPGCKFVWLPSLDAYDNRLIVNGEDYEEASARGIKVLDEKGGVVPELKEIMDIVAEKELVLSTGHYVHPVRKRVIEEAKDRGVENIDVTHVNLGCGHPSSATAEMMKEYIRIGVKNLRLCTIAFLGAGPMNPPEGKDYTFRVIKEIGAQHFVFGTDYGQIMNPPHHVGVRWWVKNAIFFGLSNQEIETVMKESPKPWLERQ